MKKGLFPLFFLASTSLLSGCDYLASYQTHIQQGNIIEENEVAALRVGMSKAAVIQLMGSPVYDNTFDEQRWIYIYTSKNGRRPLVKKQVILTFRNDRLENIARDEE
jgi:outer membrane protein assembly factor BamE